MEPEIFVGLGSPSGHSKLPVRSPGKLAFRRGQWDALLLHRHSAKVPEETILAWSRIQQSVIDQAINQWRNCLTLVSKPKANTERLL